MKRSINDWVEACHTLATSKGWWDDTISDSILTPDELLSKLMLVVTEISEAAEEVRIPGFDPCKALVVDNKPEGFPVELADAVIRIFDICGRLGIDLDAAIETKHRYNETRAIRHGGKLA